MVRSSTSSNWKAFEGHNAKLFGRRWYVGTECSDSGTRVQRCCWFNWCNPNKLDGTAKGGVVVAIAHELKVPIRFVGVGEKAEDLRPFDARAFVESLWSADLTLNHRSIIPS